MEIPGTSQVQNESQISGIKRLKSMERLNKNHMTDKAMTIKGLQGVELSVTECIDLVNNEPDAEVRFTKDYEKNCNNNTKNSTDSLLRKDRGTKPGPDVTSGISTVTSISSKASRDVEEEIEALYNWVPEIANHFTIVKKIGEGTFSSVYLAKLKHYPEIDEFFALKHIIPTSHPSRIENELRCLLRIGGKDNVMGVKLCLRNRDHLVIVMPYFPHDKFQDYLQELSLEEAKEYMKNLLLALRRVHQFNVIHRDVKPSNFLYNRKSKEFALVDFGLATGPMLSDPAKDYKEKKKLSSSLASASTSSLNVVCKAGPNRSNPRAPLSPSKLATCLANEDNLQRTSSKKMESCHKPGTFTEPRKYFAKNFSAARTHLEGLCGCYGKPIICELCIARNNQVAPRAGTAGFRAPEVLMKSPDQDTAVDVWSAGVIFLSLLSGRYPFFRAQDDLGYLAQILALLGSKTCIQAATAFGKLLTLNESIPSVDLEAACLRLRESQMAANSCVSDEIMMSWNGLKSDAFDLLQKLLDPNPKTRINACAALQHPFFMNESSNEDT